MNKIDYFTRAESWALDTRDTSSKSRRTAWIVAGTAAGIAMLEAVAIAMMMPLKTVQPITLLVDRQTGFVQALDPVSPRRIAADEALTQSYLAQYVIAREGFDRATAQADYRRVAIWSAGKARASYLAEMPATNPNSPLRLYTAGTVISVRVKSVSRLSDGTALVRFDTFRQDINGTAQVGQPWVSVVRYQYVDAPMQMEDRLTNPLGFQVTSYRRDAETPQPAGEPGAFAPPPSPLSVGVAPPSAVVQPGIGQRPVSVNPGAGRRTVPIENLPVGSPLTGNAEPQ